MNNHQEESAHSPEERCLNCEAPLLGQYCHHCGQKRGTTKLTLGQWFMLFWDNLVSIDGKLLKTIVPLLFMPGRVSRDYIEGRRARYVDPVRLFLVSSFLLFLVVEYSIEPVIIKGNEISRQVTEGSNIQAMLQESTQQTSLEERVTLSLQEEIPGDMVRKGIHVFRQFFEWLPKLLILFMPLYALCLKLFYLRHRNFYFTDHLIVSAYLHAVICFMYFVLFIALRFTQNAWVFTGLWLLPASYHYLTLKTVYRQGWIRTFFTFLFSTALYFCTLFVITSLFVYFLWWKAA
ncbi:DUF3667 domain-containing protein [Thermonema rossianum]|uniref:DUF3667 domain-containing protein n=1 Tax=Thermonema rossianum TaxID=55505 RepID=UPI0005709558|nr:DUF3667 domain-containing protein [Thermonema rossianum]